MDGTDGMAASLVNHRCDFPGRTGPPTGVAGPDATGPDASLRDISHLPHSGEPESRNQRPSQRETNLPGSAMFDTNQRNIAFAEIEGSR
jgi:hypothetical protein